MQKSLVPAGTQETLPPHGRQTCEQGRPPQRFCTISCCSEASAANTKKHQPLLAQSFQVERPQRSLAPLKQYG